MIKPSVVGWTEVHPYKIGRASSSLELVIEKFRRNDAFCNDGLQSVVRGSEVKMSSVGTAHMYS